MKPDFLDALGIVVRHRRAGVQKVKCPKCHRARRHQEDCSLLVKIKPDGFIAIKCFHCGWEEWSVPENGASRSRTPRAPIVRPRADTLKPASEGVYDYLSKRRISRAIVDRYKVGFGSRFMPQTGREEPVIMFPYYRDGELINVKYRTINKHFCMEKDAEKIYYGLDDIAGADEVIICEGEIDKLSFAEAGLANCLSVPTGAPSATVGAGKVDLDHDAAGYAYVGACWDRILVKTPIILAVDGDAKGVTLQAELARRYGPARCKVVAWPEGCKDANDVLVQHGGEKLRELVLLAEPLPIEDVFLPSRFHEAVKGIFKDNLFTGYGVGWRSADEIFRLLPGSLVCVTGMPSHGKSSWIDAVVLNMVLNHGWKSLMISFETPPAIHCAYFISRLVGKPFFPGDYERMSEFERDESLTWLSEYIMLGRAEAGAPTPEWILEKADAAVIRYGIKIIVVDPWNEIEHHRPREMTETEYISVTLQKFRRFAQARGVVFIVIAHPTKLRKDDSGEYPVPGPYDVSGSANWANKADFFLTVWRDLKMRPPQTKIFIGKARWDWVAKQGSDVTLYYDPPTGRFSEVPPAPHKKAIVEEPF